MPRFTRRTIPRERYFDRDSSSIAANTLTSTCSLTLDSGTITGIRVAIGTTLAAAGVCKAEAWLQLQRVGATAAMDLTTSNSGGENKDLLGFWQIHLSQTVPFNINENMRVRRKCNDGDQVVLYMKGPSGFDQESMLLVWQVE